jgi:hypothetical protein
MTFVPFFLSGAQIVARIVAQPSEKAPSYGIPASSAARIIDAHNMSLPKAA